MARRGEQYHRHKPAYAQLPPASGRPSGSAALAAPHACIRAARPTALGRPGTRRCAARLHPYGRTSSVWERLAQCSARSCTAPSSFWEQQGWPPHGGAIRVALPGAQLATCGMQRGGRAISGVHPGGRHTPAGVPLVPLGGGRYLPAEAILASAPSARMPHLHSHGTVGARPVPGAQPAAGGCGGRHAVQRQGQHTGRISKEARPAASALGQGARPMLGAQPAVSICLAYHLYHLYHQFWKGRLGGCPLGDLSQNSGTSGTSGTGHRWVPTGQQKSFWSVRPTPEMPHLHAQGTRGTAFSLWHVARGR